MEGGGGAGGGPTGVTVPCGRATECDVDGGQFCCVPMTGGKSGECATNCQGNEATLACNEPDECPGQVCCLRDSMGNYTSSECRDEDDCFDATLCDPAADDCPPDSDCVQHPDMPPGYFYCD